MKLRNVKRVLAQPVECLENFFGRIHTTSHGNVIGVGEVDVGVVKCDSSSGTFKLSMMEHSSIAEAGLTREG